MRWADVRYSVATYSGTERVYFSDEDLEDAFLIALAKNQVRRKAGGSLPFGAESWRVVRRGCS